jgi:hypothetical protein
LNGKRAKRLRKEAANITYKWLGTIVNEPLDRNNFTQYLPDEKYFFARGQQRLYVMHPKWVFKQLKRGKVSEEILNAKA